MTKKTRQLLDEALSLPDEQREVLVEALSDSLSEKPLELSPEWKTEVENRIAQIERGEVEPVPWSTIQADLDKLLR